MAQGFLDTQVLLKVGVELRMESGPEGQTLLGLGFGEKGERTSWPLEESPWLDSNRLGLGGSHCWDCREAFYRRLDTPSVGKAFSMAPHGRSL